MMKKITVFLLVFALLASPAFAAFEASPWTSESGYGQKATGKLVFGLKNLLLGWTEIFTEPYESKSIQGVGKGLFNGIVDTVGGALHTVTFFVPQVDVKLPDGGVDF